MKIHALLTQFVILLTFSVLGQSGHTIPIAVKNHRTYITIRTGDLTISDILLDTGFAYDGLMLFDPAYGDSLDMTSAVNVQIGGAGSGQASKAIMIDSAEFSVGEAKMVNHRIIILQGEKSFGSNGIIGYSVFGHYITAFDYDKNTMTLYDPDSCEADDSWTVIPLFFRDNNIPWLNASVVIENETPISLSMYIDFAADDEILLLEKPNQKFKLPEETKEVYLGTGLSGDIYGKTGIISKLIIGPFEMKNINASFANALDRSKQKDADAVIGNECLRRFNLIFDYPEKKLFLKPNAHFYQ
jgi:hypothetical protein